MAIRTPSADKWNRTIRTLIQVGIVQLLLQGYNAFAGHPLTNEQYAVVTALGTACLTLIQNFLEDETPFPAMGKTPPSTGQNPVT